MRETASGAPSERPRLRRVAPLGPIALAVMVGIIADRALDPLSTAVWAALACGLGLSAAFVGRWEGLQRIALVGSFVALSGAWHHLRWADLAPDHLARFVDTTPRPAWLRGVLLRVPEFRPPELPRTEGYTRTILAVNAINNGQRWYPASGRVGLFIDGDRTGLAMGEPVIAVGELSAIAGPLNPGETDRRTVLRAEGVRLRLGAAADGVWPDSSGQPSPALRALGRAREWARTHLTAAIGPETGPLAAALLLGRREAIDPDTNDAFARTGTMHLLAISGLHLQVFAVALLLAGRVVGLGPRWSAALAAGTTIAYAVLVGPMPSVVRSASMTLATCIAVLRCRFTRPANVLAAAALVTLAWNPSDLFDVGCQLSFVAVAAIFWLLPPVAGFLKHDVPRPVFEMNGPVIEFHSPDDPLDALERRLEPRWKKGLRWLGEWFAWMFLVSFVVSLATAPLVALRFHLVSPIGVLLNLPLIPLTSVALVLAALTLALAALWLPLAFPTAWACTHLLSLSEAIVRWGVDRSWGHVFTPGPAAWWVLGFYVLLAVVGFAWAARWRAPARRGAGLALAAWLAVGLGLWLWPARSNRPPEVEVLAVGHGLAVVVRDGSGGTQLYDCGRLGDPHVGRRLIAPALWARGTSRLDAVYLSHADADHVNGLPDLLERFDIEAVYVPPDFARSGAGVLDAVRAQGVPVRTVAAGQRWTDGGDAPLVFTAEHPPPGWLPGAADNDRSLVLSLTFRGRQLLLTGDLDGAGLAELVARPTPGVAALLAPHHGGRSANPPWFHAWARPGLVLVSQRAPATASPDALSHLTAQQVPVLRTWERGSLRLRWEPSGLVARGFLDAVEPTAPALSSQPPGRPRILRHPDLATGPLLSVIRYLQAVIWNPAFVPWAVALLGLVLGILAAALLAIVEWGAWSLVRPGRRTAAVPADVSADSAPAWQELTIQTPGGIRLAGSWRPAGGSCRRVAVLLHGFGEDREALRGRAEALARHGWHIALTDSRARGRSDGDWTTFGVLEAGDLRAWLDTLTTLVAPADSGRTATPPAFVAWGRSMGAAIALRAAADDSRLRALVLEAPYAELRAGVTAWLRLARLPGFLAGLILHRAGRLAGVLLDRPRPVELAPRVDLPVLILHGTDDPIAPAVEVRRLAAALPNPPTLLEIPGARHNDVFDRGGAELAATIAAFLDRAIPDPHGCADS